MKVQYPGIAEGVKTDIDMLKVLLKPTKYYKIFKSSFNEIEERIAEAFPADAMLYRASRVPSSLASAVRQVFSDHGDERQPGKALHAFFNLHPGLDLRGVLKAATDAPAAIKAIEERVGWVSRFQEANADLDLLSIDYSVGSADLATLSFEGLPEQLQLPPNLTGIWLQFHCTALMFDGVRVVSFSIVASA